MSNKSYEEILRQIQGNGTKSNSSVNRFHWYRFFKHCFPIPIIIFSMLCIILTILVALRKGLWKPTSQYLITLALVDLLTMPLLLYLTIDNSQKPEEELKIAYFLGEMLETLLLASNWITTLVAAERFFAITHPLKTHRLRRKHRRILVVGVLLFSFLCKLPNFISNTYGKSEHHLLNGYNTWIVQVLFYMLAPFIILLVVNIKLIQELLRMSKYFGVKFEKSCEPTKGFKASLTVFFKSMCPFKYFMIDRDSSKARCIDSTFINSRHRKKSIREERRIIMTLVMLILTFFFFQAPFVLVSVYENMMLVMSRYNEPYISPKFIMYIKTLSIPALSLKPVFYFVFYCWFCNKFMKTVRGFIGCRMHFSRNRHDKNDQIIMKRRSHPMKLNPAGKKLEAKKLLYIYDRERGRDILNPTMHEESLSKVYYLNNHKPCKHHHVPSSLCLYIDKTEVLKCKKCHLSNNYYRDSTTTEGTEEPVRTPLGFNYYSNHAFSSFLVSENLGRESTPNVLERNQTFRALNRDSRFLSSSDNNIDYYSNNYAASDLNDISSLSDELRRSSARYSVDELAETDHTY